MPKFKGFVLKFEFRDPEEVMVFLRGAIIAKQNNSSPLWDDVIAGINTSMETYWREQMEEDLGARAAAGMP